MRKHLGGQQNAGKLPVMPPGFKWTTADTTTAVEAELLAQRTVNRNETSSIYMVPAPFAGILDKTSYNNITTLREMAYTDGLAPPLVLSEQVINAHVVRGLLRQDDIFVEFDLGALLKGDRLKEIKALREAIGMMLMSPNEGRDVLNLKRSSAPGADSLWAPVNNLSALEADVPAAE
jgi:phage portal protein BeeE